jgi:hypothetical protein
MEESAYGGAESCHHIEKDTHRDNPVTMEESACGGADSCYHIEKERYP